MVKQKKHKNHKFEYNLVRIIEMIALSLPLKSALFVGDLIGNIFYFLIKLPKVKLIGYVN